MAGDKPRVTDAGFRGTDKMDDLGRL